MSIAEKLTQIAENEQKVFDAGKKAEYDHFWDTFQLEGKRVDYQYGFGSVGWNDKTFKPKYDIILGVGVTGSYTFWCCGVSNLKEALDKRGVKLDTSKCKYMHSFLRGARCVEVPTIDLSECSNSTGTASCFSSTYLITIEKIVFSKTTNISSTMFQNATSLQNVVCEGVIAKSINFGSCPLTKASITSAFNAFSATIMNQTATFKKDAVNVAFETSEGAADGSTSAEWLNLIATKPNWTISLV